ncbi:MAG: lipoprotein-releasing ABC transporter permease subunit [Desulfatibacillaceae bacterium]|nr:lipoprotein-releasing ABC transporter permease subunit [Desulfatibacillaceae bacterium]
MGFESFVSGRYLRAKRSEAFISINTFISTCGVLVGVMALVVVVAVMTGAEQKMRSMILGLSPHLMVLSHTGNVEDYGPIVEALENTPGIAGVAPFVQEHALLRGPRTSAGAVIRGMDLHRSNQVVDIGRFVSWGSVEDLKKPALDGQDKEESFRPGILLGSVLATTLGVRPGDTITLVTPKTTLTPFMAMPGIRRIAVAGIVDSGWYEYDAGFAWMELSDAQAVFRMGDAVTGVEASVRDIYGVGDVRRHIQRVLGLPYWVQDWIQLNSGLFKALELEKLAMFVLLLFIVMVAALNIASTLIMTVMEKKKDIAVLKAMGATRRSILKIFIHNGMTIGITGTALGVSAGSILCYIQDRYGVVRLDPTVYPFGELPVSMELLDVSVIAGAALLICFLATLYPAWQASRLDPVETIRYG